MSEHDGHDHLDERPDRPVHDPRAGCVFCAILAGTRGADFVLREPAAAAFLDVKPLFKGHVLVVPATHVETLPDIVARLNASDVKHPDGRWTEQNYQSLMARLATGASA